MRHHADDRQAGHEHPTAYHHALTVFDLLPSSSSSNVTTLPHLKASMKWTGPRWCCTLGKVVLWAGSVAIGYASQTEFPGVDQS